MFFFETVKRSLCVKFNFILKLIYSYQQRYFFFDRISCNIFIRKWDLPNSQIKHSWMNLFLSLSSNKNKFLSTRLTDQLFGFVFFK